MSEAVILPTPQSIWIRKEAERLSLLRPDLHSQNLYFSETGGVMWVIHVEATGEIVAFVEKKEFGL